MAEFKLGRIRFVWQGDWSPGTVYVADDVVSNGGKSYICIANHTSSPEFATDFGGETNKWEIVSDGTSWRGSWEEETVYNPGDVVKYGALVYICEAPHTSATYQSPDFLGLEEDQEKWTPFATSFNWLGDWTSETRYRQNDLVRYGGYVYVCNIGHISAEDNELGLEEDQNKWSIFSNGIDYLGEWATAVRYKLNDVVKYGGNLWICVLPHTSDDFDTEEEINWEILLEGFQFENSWNSSIEYQMGDTVTYGGYVYVAKTININKQPTSNPGDWTVFTTGFNFRGDWSSLSSYKVGDVVRAGGTTYAASLDNIGQEPPNVTYWNELNPGISWTNSTETYTQVAGTNLLGNGSGAKFDVIRSKTVYTVSLSSGFAGTNYVEGTIIKLSGENLGGLTGSNDIIITVTGTSLGTITNFTWSGRSSTWKEGTRYIKGDVVFFGASSYISTVTHTASLVNRPDNDVTASTWNILSLGSETFALTTPGDLLYYGESGPTRLPIGIEGQILRVTDGEPSWANYGLINNVVYVGPLGLDTPSPDSGLTIDRPWRSVRYACNQILDGYLNPNLKVLLRRNKQFLMKEVTNWITDTYTIVVTSANGSAETFTTASTSPLNVGMPIKFSGTVFGGITAGVTYYVHSILSATEFLISDTSGGLVRNISTGSGSMTATLSYDSAVCERDTGYIVDALIYDICRGGTLKTTLAAQSYYSVAGNAYITANFGTQKIQTIAAYNYLEDLILKILNNETPETVYQIKNQVNDIAEQFIDPTLVAEAAGVSKVSDLISIITTGIDAGSSTAVPPAIVPNTTIFIKTGTYQEILPIVVPEYTALVGDELRTSVVQPAFAVDLLETDKPKTTSALNRIKAIIPNLLTNTEVAKSLGNTEQQKIAYNAYLGTVESSIRTKVNIVTNILEKGIEVAPSFEITDPTSYDAGYFNARRLIELNRSFIVAEVEAYMNENYNEIWTELGSEGQDTCTRDIGYILDALRYDLTYGGNLETVVAARSYYSNGTFVEPSEEKTAALAVQTRIKDIIDDIATGVLIVKTTGNALTQTTSGTPGSSAAATFAQDRIQEIYDTIDTGITPVEILPSTAWVNSNLVATIKNITDLKDLVKEKTINWITTNYPTLVFNSETCSRDVGYIVDAVVYDVLFNSNFRSVTSGRSYRRSLTSTQVVIEDQLESTVGAIIYVGGALQQIISGLYSVETNLNSMLSVIKNGLSEVSNYRTPDPISYDSGYFNARRLVEANKEFIVAEVEAYMIENYSSVWTGLGETGQNKCKRDIEYILDGLLFDLTYGGNLATVIAARSYYSNGIFVEPAGEKVAALAVQARIKDIIDNIIQGDTAGWTKSTGNIELQVTVGTPGSSAAATFAQDRIQEIYDTIDTGTTPTTIAPSISWVASSLTTANSKVLSKKAEIQQKAIHWINENYPNLVYDEELCSRDIGYILDAFRYDLMFSSNFLSLWNAMSYRRGLASTQLVLGSQLAPTLDIVSFTATTVKELILDTYNTDAPANRTVELAETIKNIVNSGFGAIPTLKLPNPTGYGSTLIDTAYSSTGNASGNTSTYQNARAQIEANYEFIKAEVRAWLQNPANGFDAIWNSFSSEAQDACIRDVGYILDGIRYDITYGGNTQSLIVGSAYYSNFVLTIGSDELPATVAAYGRLRTILGQVIQETLVTKSPNNLLNQDTSGSAGNAPSAAFAQARVDNVINWINNGSPDATILPATSWVSAEFLTSYNNLIDKKEEIQDDVVAWVNKFFQNITYNADICRRDAGYMVDAIALDMLTGSNFASIKAGMSYYRATDSAREVITDEKEATVGAINFLKHKVKRVASVTPVASAESIITSITDYINGGAVPGIKWPNPSNITSEFANASRLLWDNKAFIQAEVIAYITENYPSIIYNEDTCSRDVGFIIDALRYDLTYGGNYASKQAGAAYYSFATLQIDGADKTATLAAYGYLKDLAEQVVVNATISSPLQLVVPQVTKDVLESAGSTNAETEVGNLIDVITNIIDLGIVNGVPSVTITTITGGTTFTTSSAHGLKIGDEVKVAGTINGLEANVTYYVQSTPLTNTFTLSSYYTGPILNSFVNGTSLTITAEITKLPVITQVSAELKQQHVNLMGSKETITNAVTAFIQENYPTLVYNSETCERDVGLILDAVGYDLMLDSNFRSIKAGTAYYRAAASLVVGAQKRATLAAFRFLKNNMATYLTASSTAVERSNNLMSVILKIIDKGAGENPEINGTVNYNNDLSTIKAVETLRSNVDFLSKEATAWISNTFGGTITATSSATNEVTTSTPHNLIAGDPVVFSGVLFGGLSLNTVYYVKTATDTKFTLSLTKSGPTEVLGTALGSATVTYFYNEASCRRDMREYVNALIYDLQYPGTHKAIKAAELYLNAVNGSTMSDMFHVRNGCGVRNMTVNGLNGDLTEENEFGTRRPTAGAYVSLDPGFGPNDSESWVTNKSTYVQNVTTFGTGCVGCKIDGAIHSGGNRSIVANDFTQILSDGIGVWCTGSNSLTELVSVFAYYNYAGYLAELGGRIRATNGNSSYGTYGVIAEGTDKTEIPLYAILDNYAQQSIVGNVFTDAENEVLRLEFTNAGTNYTNAEFAISGAGFNATAIDDEFRDSAVFETRLIDLNDSNGVGGENYANARNVGQGGDRNSIIIANTDTALSNAYAGMRIILTAGTGVGQYANILTYNNGTKLMQVYKDSFTPVIATNTTDSGDLITVASNSTLYVDMPIYFTGTAFGNIVANQLYYVKTLNGTTQFTISEAQGGPTFNVTTASGTLTILAAGWDHVVAGKAISATLDLTTGYQIEPRISYSEPGYTATARTMSSTATWNSATYAVNRYVAIANNSTSTSYSLDGKTWTAGGTLPATANWTDVAFGGGQGATATAIVGGLGGSGAVLEAVLGTANSLGLPGPTQVASIRVVNGGQGYTTPPTIVITPVSGGANATATCTVLNGVIQEVTVTSTGSGYGAIPTVAAITDRVTEIQVNTRGKGYTSTPTVTLTGGGASVQATATATLLNTGVLSIALDTSGSGYTSTPTVTITDPLAKFVTIASGTNNNASLAASANANANWVAGSALPATNFASIAYGNGIYVTVGGASSAASSTTGTSWISRTIPTLSLGTYSSVVFGGNRFVAIATGGTETAYSDNGISWQAGGLLPASSTWSSMAYGNGRFVAIASGGRNVAYSIDRGLTWTAATPGLPSSQTWKTIRYGQGLFFAIAEGTTVAATSPDGINWTTRAMPGTSTNWRALAFGNPNKHPTWVAASNTSGTVAASVDTGTRALGRMAVDDGSITEIRMIEPGSGYPKGVLNATTNGTNLITVNNTINLVNNQPIVFTGINGSNLEDSRVYYVVSGTITSTQFQVSLLPNTGVPVVLETTTDLNGTYRALPIVEQFDANRTVTAPVEPRVADGALGNPSFTNRGTGNTTAVCEIDGDGYADLFQPSTFISVANLFDIPEPGSNVEFASIPNTWYKLVSISNITGIPGNYKATFQISPGLTVLEAPRYGDLITITNKYSQVRLTGHDFLYIGTGNQARTNYPFVDITTAIQARQEEATGGGRVFFTSTDQDGNFNVGNLFGVQQSTGTATLNADAFNLSGLQSLQLGGISVGIGSAIITQFSTDPFFTANSDNIVPTQRAIKSYITAQIGGGQSSLNVNTLTAGVVFVANDTITTTSGGQLNITAKMNFTGGIDGAPVALGFFLQR